MNLRPIAVLCVLFLPGAAYFDATTAGTTRPLTGLRASAEQSPASDLLASYGDWIDGRRKSVELVAVNLDEVRNGLARLAPAFLHAGSSTDRPGDAERKRRLLTTFALEVAAAGASRHAQAAARLVEWACPYVRSHTPVNDFDRAWQLAALAVLEGGIDAAALGGHIDHAQNAFPDEPRLRLARPIADEQVTAPAEVVFLQTAEIEAARGTDALRRQGERARASERAVAGFRGLLTDPGLRAEASLRLGHVQLVMHRYEEAVASWAEVEQFTSDRSLVYLVRLFRGLAYDRLAGRASSPVDAQRYGADIRSAKAAYLQALDTSPGAHSATMGLAALTFRHIRSEDSDRLLEALVKDNDPRRDPWWSYYGADWRFWYPRIERVRSFLTTETRQSEDRDIGFSDHGPTRRSGPAMAVEPLDRTSPDRPNVARPGYAESALAPQSVRVGSVLGEISRKSAGSRWSRWGLTPGGGTPQDIFRSGVDGVSIQAYVRRGARPVGGLAATDFELRDNGVLQQLTAVSIEHVPVDLTLLLDVSASVDGPMLVRLKDAVRDTAALLRPGDRIRLLAVSQVLTEIFSLRSRGQALPLDSLVAQGATSLHDGLAAAMMRTSEPGRRQLVVAFTDGRDSTSIIDEDTAKEIARLTDAVVDIVRPVWDARRAEASRAASTRGRGSLPAGGNVVLGQVEMGDRARAPDGGQRDPLAAFLSDLISPAAGQVFTLGPKDSISQVFRRMLEQFRASYVLQYVPRGVTAAGWHDVTVTVTARGRYEIRARKGYQGR